MTNAEIAELKDYAIVLSQLAPEVSILILKALSDVSHVEAMKHEVKRLRRKKRIRDRSNMGSRRP